MRIRAGLLAPLTDVLCWSETGRPDQAKGPQSGPLILVFLGLLSLSDHAPRRALNPTHPCSPPLYSSPALCPALRTALGFLVLVLVLVLVLLLRQK
jgi:hypothetical protein